MHSEAANNTSTAKVDDQVLNAQMDALQSADVLVLNEVDWGMKRSDYRAVVKISPMTQDELGLWRRVCRS